MRLLLDTHAFTWWVNGSERLSRRARRAINSETNVVFVSAASAWEVSTKYHLRRLDEAAATAPDIPAAIAAQGFQELPITVQEAARAGALPGPHRNRFHRLLIAQALSRDLVLISNESTFNRYAIHRLW